MCHRMRRVLALRAFALSSVFGLSLALAIPEARAQSCVSPRFSTCIDSDTYWPHPGPQRFAAVGGTEIVAPGQTAFSLAASYQNQPLLLDGPSPGLTGTRHVLIDHQINANFLFAHAISRRLQLDLAVPVTLYQSGAGASPIRGGDALRDTAVRDVRVGFAFVLIPRTSFGSEPAQPTGDGFAVTSRFALGAPIGDNDSFAGDRAVVYAPSVAADVRLGRLFFGGELGGRIRPVTEFAGARIGTQLTAALGAGVDIFPRRMLSSFIEGRAYANLPMQRADAVAADAAGSAPTTGRIVPAEWLVGLRTAPVLGGDLSFFAGGGGPIPLTEGALPVPRFRVVLGASFAPSDLDTDGDGVVDRLDRCPSQPGPLSAERPGCPEPPAEPPPAPPPVIAPVPAAPPPEPVPAAPPPEPVPAAPVTPSSSSSPSTSEPQPSSPTEESSP
jgi:OOP family OmpA-OmpF porin